MIWKAILKAVFEIFKTFGVILPEFWKNKQINQEVHKEVIEEKNKNKIIKVKKRRLKRLIRFFRRKSGVTKKIEKIDSDINVNDYFVEEKVEQIDESKNEE